MPSGLSVTEPGISKRGIAVIAGMFVAAACLVGVALKTDAGHNREAKEREAKFLKLPIQTQFESAKHGAVSLTCIDAGTGKSYTREKPQRVENYQATLQDPACRLDPM